MVRHRRAARARRSLCGGRGARQQLREHLAEGLRIDAALIKAKRLAGTLGQVAQASGKHARAVIAIIAASLRGDPSNAPRDIASLLSLLREQLVGAGAKLDDAAARAWLEAIKRGGKTAKLKKALLA